MTKPTDNLQEQGSRTAKGQFAKGHTQNPKGRIKGSRNKATQAAMTLLEGETEALTRKAVELALEGDTTALRLCLERIVSPAKERTLPPLELPDITNAADLPKLTQSLMQYLASGELMPSQITALASLVAAHTKAIETQETEQRLQNLEALLQRNT